MTQTQSPTDPRMIFVNLAVKDVGRALGFWRALGFDCDPRFTDESAASIVIRPDAIHLMLLSEAHFSSFTRKAICDTSAHTETLIALSCASRAEVDQLVKDAVAAGGAHAMDPTDLGFMYGWSFCDPDGHHFELVWMDPAQVPAA